MSTIALGKKPLFEDREPAILCGRNQLPSPTNLDRRDPSGTEKTSAQTDTYHGRFVRLIPDEEIVEVIEFETRNPKLSGPMTIRTRLVDAGDGTDLIAVHENLPAGLSAEENEAGWRDSLSKLVAYLKRREATTPRA